MAGSRTEIQNPGWGLTTVYRWKFAQHTIELELAHCVQIFVTHAVSQGR